MNLASLKPTRKIAAALIASLAVTLTAVGNAYVGELNTTGGSAAAVAVVLATLIPSAAGWLVRESKAIEGDTPEAPAA